MDALCLKAGVGVPRVTPPIPVAGIGCVDVRATSSHVPKAAGRSSALASNSISLEKKPAARPRRASSWVFSFGRPLISLWPGRGAGNRNDAVAVDDAVSVDEMTEKEENAVDRCESPDEENRSWVLKILHVRSLWRDEGEWRESRDHVPGAEEGKENKVIDGIKEGDGTEIRSNCQEGCTVHYDEDVSIQHDRDSFSKLLKKVSLQETWLYSQMSYLGNLAYSISRIKPKHLLKYHGLRFVTSSLEKKELLLKADNEKLSTEVPEAEEITKEPASGKDEKTAWNHISASTAYQIAASAASYLHSHTRSYIPFKSFRSKESEISLEMDMETSDDDEYKMNEEVASLMATTDSVTAVVAAKEEVKQAVADDLSSTHSSPCEWFICDDDKSATRFLVIQGSESMSSWKANLLFEPVKFEGFDVLVHRGIYEAAKGIYEQMLPEIRSHLQIHGDDAKFRFTGHSLGGSLATLVNLMLVIRSEVPLCSLLPVIAFGAPSIMCGGDLLLRELGLPRNHVQAITMHRDIVPRAFSCNYPSHVAEFLKAINRNFRNHPCLRKQKLLYAPMGEWLILQPEEKFSPSHHLLPPGSGLYLLSRPALDVSQGEKQISAALATFLNSPHPLEILSDRSAYGSTGTIRRDHDMLSYKSSLRNLYRKELNRVRKARREMRKKVWWPFIILHDLNTDVVLASHVGFGNLAQGQISSMMRTGSESLKQFNRFVSSRNLHSILLSLLPAQLVIIGIYRLYRVISPC